jgi:hypothetical protein
LAECQSTHISCYKQPCSHHRTHSVGKPSLVFNSGAANHLGLAAGRSRLSTSMTGRSGSSPAGLARSQLNAAEKLPPLRSDTWQAAEFKPASQPKGTGPPPPKPSQGWRPTKADSDSTTAYQSGPPPAAIAKNRLVVWLRPGFKNFLAIPVPIYTCPCLTPVQSSTR